MMWTALRVQKREQTPRETNETTAAHLKVIVWYGFVAAYNKAAACL